VQRLAFAVLLAGCPPPPRYAVVVAPADALVALSCGPTSTATRTDDLGRARLVVHGDVDPAACTLVVGKPGLPTVERSGVELCSTPTGCRAMVVTP
jgi:hypothetical protein